VTTLAFAISIRGSALWAQGYEFIWTKRNAQEIWGLIGMPWVVPANIRNLSYFKELLHMKYVK
jgi:hypothetical protein